MVGKKSEQQAGLQPLKVEQSTNTSCCNYTVLFGILFLGKWEIVVVPTTAKNTSVTFISNHKDFQEVPSLAKFHIRKIGVGSGILKTKTILRLHARKEQNQTRIKQK